MLKEWDREWREKFGGEEKDEVEGEDVNGASDDEDGDEEASPVPVTSPAAAAATASTSATPLAQPQPERIRQDTLPDYSSFLQCRYADSPDWDWPEMLGMLTVNDLKDMAKNFFFRLAKKVGSSLDASFS